jgi:hypothetical protein
MSGDFDFEPVRGIPAGLPKDERILWQGTTDWWAFAKSALHVRGLAVYFLLLMGWRFGIDMADGGTLATGFISAVWVVPMVIVVMGILLGYAYMVQRTTVYSITSERVLFRTGVAFSITATVPFNLIRSADVSVDSDGTGLLAIAVERGHRVSWVMFWPHVRPWRISEPHPAFRSIRNVETVAKVLSDALAQHAEEDAKAKKTASNGPGVTNGETTTPNMMHNVSTEMDTSAAVRRQDQAKTDLSTAAATAG